MHTLTLCSAATSGAARSTDLNAASLASVSVSRFLVFLFSFLYFCLRCSRGVSKLSPVVVFEWWCGVEFAACQFVAVMSARGTMHHVGSTTACLAVQIIVFLAAYLGQMPPTFPTPPTDPTIVFLSPSLLLFPRPLGTLMCCGVLMGGLEMVTVRRPPTAMTVIMLLVISDAYY